MLLTVAIVAVASTPSPAPPVCLRAGNAAAIALVVVRTVPDYPERIPALGPSHLEGFAGAQVIVRSAGKVIVKKRTDASGQVCIVVPAGEHTVGVTAVGFENSVLRRVRVRPGAQVNRTIQLVPSEPSPAGARPDQVSR